VKKIILMIFLFAFCVNIKVYAVPRVVEDGKFLGSDLTGDIVDWLEIAREPGLNGEICSLILRLETIDYCAVDKENFRAMYLNSDLRKILNNWYKENELSGLKSIAVTSDVLEKVGSFNSRAENGFSEPSGVFANEEDEDILFPLSFQEAKKFIGKSYRTYYKNYLNVICSSAKACSRSAIINSRKLTDDKWWWLRSPGDMFLQTSVVRSSGFIDEDLSRGKNYVRPAAWVRL